MALGRLTLPKANKLLRASDFENLKDNPLFFKTQSFKVFYKENSLKEARLGISASSRFANAVQRNKFKRTIREFFRKSLKIKSFNSDFLFVIHFPRNLDNKTLDPSADKLKRDLSFFESKL